MFLLLKIYPNLKKIKKKAHVTTTKKATEEFQLICYLSLEQGASSGGGEKYMDSTK